jgi:hypothetical protein
LRLLRRAMTLVSKRFGRLRRSLSFPLVLCDTDSTSAAGLHPALVHSRRLVIRTAWAAHYDQLFQRYRRLHFRWDDAGFAHRGSRPTERPLRVLPWSDPCLDVCVLVECEAADIGDVP